jgi:formamidopyrimidine-DNA glycosylase
MVLSNGLGIDWMTAERAALASLVQTWASSRRQLGLLITDQSCVAGIGIAWGSEILARAGNLRPELPARAQNLRTLASAMLSIREEVQSAYTAFVTHAPDLREVINDWYENLYTLRTMHVYKKGRPLKVGGRTWWVSA